MGYPISHSTHSGFGQPVTGSPAAFAIAVFQRPLMALCPAFVVCAVSGVGHILTIVASLRPVLPSGSGPPVEAVGVGHIFTASVSGGVETFPAFRRSVHASSVSSDVLPERGVGKKLPEPAAVQEPAT